MRHRIKKIPTLSKLSHKFNHHLLHSDKSTYTYFYKGKVKVGSLGKHILYSPSIPLLSSVVLPLVLGMMVSPLSPVSGADKASASSITEDECRRSTTIGMQLMGVTGDNVTLTNNTVNDDIKAGRISKVSQDFNVVACNAKSYKIYVQAETSMLKNTSVPDALYGVGENVAESSFPENTWGYNISSKDDTENATSLTYNTVPALSNNIPEAYSANGSTTTTGKNFTITFAANFPKNKPAGHYTSDVLLSTVIEPVTAQELWNGITYMQDMTPEACEGGDELGRQLIDKRDGKSYWVAKLNDGNCWMTQNLDLDIPAEGLKATDTDITADWSPGQTTITGTLSTDVWPWPTDTNNPTIAEANIVRSYDTGEYVYTTPTTLNYCNSTTNGLSDCTSKGWVDVSSPNMKASEEPDFGTQVVDNTYNAHYLAGNHYSWAAVTAGQSSAIISTNKNDYPVETTQSICPKGWTLPKSGLNTEKALITTSGTFANLFESYGWKWNMPANAANKTYTNTTNGETSYDLRAAPFYFFYGGHVYDGSLFSAGGGGNYWSSTAQSMTNVYTLSFGSSDANPSNYSKRYIGLSVRCVAR